MMTRLRPTRFASPTSHQLNRRRWLGVPSDVFRATNFRRRPHLELMEDRTLLSTFLVSNIDDSGPGSLRQAILSSNAAIGGTNTIDFALHQGRRLVTSLVAIDLQSPLPPITIPVLIDGESQYSLAGSPLIELNGSQAGDGDGLTIACSGVTVRGLAIGGFAEGAGILISGANATDNTIETNDIGNAPTGTLAVPNEFGVRILGGASDNTVGGTTAAAGNVIANNEGPGVDVEGDTSVGNQITADQIFNNDASPTPSPAGALQFQGSSDVSLPDGLIGGTGPSKTLEAWFRTISGGVILGDQTTTPWTTTPDEYVPELYVGTDGKLYGGSYDSATSSIDQVTSTDTVNDGLWHSVALVIDGAAGTMTLCLDGQPLGSVSGSPQSLAGSSDQVGTGYTDSWPATPGGWYGFVGQIDDVRVWSQARSAAEIGQDMTTAPAGTESGLEAYYPFDEGQGTTVFDQTPNHNDGTLAGTGGALPTWIIGSGQAIDLGDDGITYNSAAPSQGPNNFQNFPIVIATADGGLEGSLDGSKPDTTFLIDVYASAGYGPAARARRRTTSGRSR